VAPMMGEKEQLAILGLFDGLFGPAAPCRFPPLFCKVRISRGWYLWTVTSASGDPCTDTTERLLVVTAATSFLVIAATVLFFTGG
jgi:hypothetical protein